MGRRPDRPALPGGPDLRPSILPTLPDSISCVRCQNWLQDTDLLPLNLQVHLLRLSVLDTSVLDARRLCADWDAEKFGWWLCSPLERRTLDTRLPRVL